MISVVSWTMAIEFLNLCLQIFCIKLFKPWYNHVMNMYRKHSIKASVSYSLKTATQNLSKCESYGLFTLGVFFDEGAI